MRIQGAVVVAVMLFAGIAQAKSTKEITAAKALLDAQVSAIAAADSAAFAKAFDDHAYVIFASEVEAADRSAIENGAMAWLSAQGATKVKAQKVKIASLGDNRCAWISAEIVAPALKKTWRLTEYVAPKQDPMTEQPGAGDFRVLSAELSEAIDDKSLLAKAANGELALQMAMDGGKPPGAGVVTPATFATALLVSSDPAVTLIGSAPAEFVTGKAQVSSKLKAWKKLAIAPTESVDRSDNIGGIGTSSSELWHVTITFQVKGKAVDVPFRVHVITTPQRIGGVVGEALCVAHFSVATPPVKPAALPE
jgi:hypothetical protein